MLRHINIQRLFHEADGTQGGTVDFDSLKTLEDIDNKINEIEDSVQLDEQEPGATDTSLEAKPAEENNKTTEETDQATPPANTEPPAEDKALTEDKGLVVTDEFLQQQGITDPDTLRYAEKLKGKPISEFFKSYANSQKLVGKKREELTTVPKTEEPKVQQTPEALAEARKVKDGLVINQLSQTLPKLKDHGLPPNLDEDSEEYIEWERELQYSNPALHRRYINQRESISQEVDKAYSQAVHIEQNWAKINEHTLTSELETISNTFKEMQVDPKVLGYDLTTNEKGENSVLDQILLDKDGEIDKSLISYVNGKPIINQGAVSVKFFRQNLPSIIQKSKEFARKEAAETLQSKRGPGVPPSISTTPGIQKKELTAKDFSQMKKEDLEKLIEEMEEE